jgi:hypothetical protein
VQSAFFERGRLFPRLSIGTVAEECHADRNARHHFHCRFALIAAFGHAVLFKDMLSLGNERDYLTR